MGGSNESCHSLKKYQATFKQHYFRTSKIIFRCFRCGWKNLVLTLQFGFAGVFFYGLLFLKECAFQILFSYELFTAEKIPSDIQLKHPSNKSKEDFKKSSLLSLKYLVSALHFTKFLSDCTQERFLFGFQSFTSSITLLFISLREIFQFLQSIVGFFQARS